MQKVIHAHIYNPRESFLFKTKATDKAELFAHSCSNSENCSLFKKGECMMIGFFGKKCPYGEYLGEIGPAKNSKKLSAWIEAKKKQYEGVPSNLKNPKDKIAFIGDYVYLPYAHIEMNKEVPFLAHSAFFVSGLALLEKKDWNVETILKIVNFRPHALFGGEITDYAKKTVPKFLQHLEEEDEEMYKKFLAYCPKVIEIWKLNTPKNYVGRTAFLKTTNPFKFKTEGYQGKYIVEWDWDGTICKTNSPHAYGSWGKIDNYESLEVSVKPTDKTKVVIVDNAQVNKNTIFVD